MYIFGEGKAYFQWPSGEAPLKIRLSARPMVGTLRVRQSLSVSSRQSWISPPVMAMAAIRPAWTSLVVPTVWGAIWGPGYAASVNR